MKRYVVVEKNRVKKIVVAQNAAQIPLGLKEKVYKCEPGKVYAKGDKYLSFWERVKRAIGIS